MIRIPLGVSGTTTPRAHSAGTLLLDGFLILTVVSGDLNIRNDTIARGTRRAMVRRILLLMILVPVIPPPYHQ